MMPIEHIWNTLNPIEIFTGLGTEMCKTYSIVAVLVSGAEDGDIDIRFCEEEGDSGVGALLWYFSDNGSPLCARRCGGDEDGGDNFWGPFSRICSSVILPWPAADNVWKLAIKMQTISEILCQWTLRWTLILAEQLQFLSANFVCEQHFRFTVKAGFWHQTFCLPTHFSRLRDIQIPFASVWFFSVSIAESYLTSLLWFGKEFLNLQEICSIFFRKFSVLFI